MDWMEIKSNEAECKLIYSNTVLISDIGNPAKSSSWIYFFTRLYRL